MYSVQAYHQFVGTLRDGGTVETGDLRVADSQCMYLVVEQGKCQQKAVQAPGERLVTWCLGEGGLVKCKYLCRYK